MSWSCLRCETLNEDTELACEVCELERLYTRKEVEGFGRTSENAFVKVRSSAPGWYACMVLALIAGCVLFGIQGQLRRAEETVVGLNVRVLGLEGRQAQLTAELEEERGFHRRISREWPVSLRELKVSSQPEEAAVPGSPGSFYRARVRYVSFHATLINNQPDRQARGRLCVKYYRPFEVLSTGSESSGGCSFWTNVDLAVNPQVSRGWGNDGTSIYSPGQHRIELWWEGKFIGGKYFYIF